MAIVTSYIGVGIASREIRKENGDFLVIGLKQSQERLCKGLNLPPKWADTW